MGEPAKRMPRVTHITKSIPATLNGKRVFLDVVATVTVFPRPEWKDANEADLAARYGPSYDIKDSEF